MLAAECAGHAGQSPAAPPAHAPVVPVQGSIHPHSLSQTTCITALTHAMHKWQNSHLQPPCACSSGASPRQHPPWPSALHQLHSNSTSCSASVDAQKLSTSAVQLQAGLADGRQMMAGSSEAVMCHTRSAGGDPPGYQWSPTLCRCARYLKIAQLSGSTKPSSSCGENTSLALFMHRHSSMSHQRKVILTSRQLCSFLRGVLVCAQEMPLSLKEKRAQQCAESQGL